MKRATSRSNTMLNGEVSRDSRAIALDRTPLNGTVSGTQLLVPNDHPILSGRHRMVVTGSESNLNKCAGM